MRRRRTLREAAAATALVVVRAAATGLITFAFIAVGTRLYLERSWAPEVEDPTVGAGSTPMERLDGIRRQERLEAALEVFRLRYGRYPVSLDELAQDGLVPASALSSVSSSNPYYYRPSGDTYILFQPRY